MKWYVLVIGILVYLLTGFFAVEGNERAVVCRFGRALSNPAGEVTLYGSGLHYDLPWPMSTVYRVNPNEVRTLSIPAIQNEMDAAKTVDTATGPLYLTGDTNLLHLQVGVQYRVSEQACADYLFAAESPESQLALIVEAVVADLVSQSGVDYVHPLGLAALRQQIGREVSALLQQRSLGLVVEEVSIRGVTPPKSVQAYFLDVANARADKQNSINEATAYAASKQESARAESRSIRDQAETFRQQQIAAASGEANRFQSLIGQFQRAADDPNGSYVEARQLAVQRMYWDSIRDVFQRAKGNVWVDNQQQTDLTIWRRMNQTDE